MLMGLGGRCADMDRRRLLAVLGVVGVAGCGEFDGPANVWPEPIVLEHYWGDPHVRGIRHQRRPGGADRYGTVVENSGHRAVVRIRLYWVTEGGYDPRNMTQSELRAAGYAVADERLVRMDAGERRTVDLSGRQPADALGVFLKARNLTYGARIGNDGGSGSITATLVDTTDLSNTRVLGRKQVELPAGDSVEVAFRASETFETFRVDVSTPVVP